MIKPKSVKVAPRIRLKFPSSTFCGSERNLRRYAPNRPAIQRSANVTRKKTMGRFKRKVITGWRQPSFFIPQPGSPACFATTRTKDHGYGYGSVGLVA